MAPPSPNPTEFERRARLRSGECPSHGVPLEERCWDEELGPVLGCPDYGCSFEAKAVAVGIRYEEVREEVRMPVTPKLDPTTALRARMEQAREAKIKEVRRFVERANEVLEDDSMSWCHVTLSDIADSVEANGVVTVGQWGALESYEERRREG